MFRRNHHCPRTLQWYGRLERCRSCAVAGVEMVRVLIADGSKAQTRSRSDPLRPRVMRVVQDEQGLHDLPVVTNVDFGHSDPARPCPREQLSSGNAGAINLTELVAV